MLEFRIEGMTCQGCVNAVRQAAGAAAPGREVRVSLDTGILEVGEGADVGAVAAAVERAGFQVTGRPAG